jgi:L-amino acid N-acyltransferase YncA
MHVRDARPSDAEALAAIYRPAVTEGFASFELQAPGPEAMAERVAHTQASHPWLVACAGERVLGYAYATPHRARAAYAWSVETSVYVGADAQGRGVGRILYEALLTQLRTRGFRVAIAGIALPNAPSVRLHEALGFEQAGVLRGVGYKGGAWRDVGYWQRVLQDLPQPPPAPSLTRT